ncbi:MAG: EscU/YscU/HrcU family type III secretion system export apparatus switch protein [Treponema sp.]|jgi:type III secretion system FlhB-like substrate exporter|nr:EscU/YscU/HrcU family type III secretion system export apparatus switch protein [Treponema sp.]
MKKRKIASAVGYAPEDPAPRLIVSGRGGEAERIITLAKKAGIAVVEDPALAAILDKGVKTGDLIPVWCWEAAAKILAFVLSKGKR